MWTFVVQATGIHPVAESEAPAWRPLSKGAALAGTGRNGRMRNMMSLKRPFKPLRGLIRHGEAVDWLRQKRQKRVFAPSSWREPGVAAPGSASNYPSGEAMRSEAMRVKNEAARTRDEAVDSRQRRSDRRQTPVDS